MTNEEATALRERLKNMPLYEIAGFIYRDWKKMNYAAKPYADAMLSLTNITDKYICDDGR